MHKERFPSIFWVSEVFCFVEAVHKTGIDMRGVYVDKTQSCSAGESAHLCCFKGKGSSTDGFFLRVASVVNVIVYWQVIFVVPASSFGQTPLLTDGQLEQVHI